jgi:hypothetical protein
MAVIISRLKYDRKMLGFDFLFMPPATVAPAIASLESFESLSSGDQQAIASGNGQNARKSKSPGQAPADGNNNCKAASEFSAMG